MSLEKYIESQKRIGAWDSVGKFTLDLQAQALKMSQYQLPSENHQLLKLLQLAVFLGAPSVDMNLSLGETLVSFSSKAEVGNAVEGLRDPACVEDPVGSFIASVLLSVCRQAYRRSSGPRLAARCRESSG